MLNVLFQHFSISAFQLLVFQFSPFFCKTLRSMVIKGYGSRRCARWSGLKGCAVLAFFVLALAAGCKKSPNPEQTTAVTPTNTAPSSSAPASPADTIARLHWLGKKRLAAETNAATFMTIWNLPESG